MIELRNKQILIDGQPRLLISGEVHYFRLQRAEWRDRLEKLRAAGGNTVASYIPWLCHEPTPGDYDLDGHTRPELDLGAFIDLCAELDLFFIARPGPFIMAEMKNEGVPYRLYEDHPEIVPVGWDAQPASTRTLDYLAPAFLDASRDWYAHVIPVIAARLQPNGGNVIAVQLDNEIGMLSWVSNTPDLTDNVITDFWGWLERTLGADERARRYPFPSDGIAASIRSPQEAWAGVLMQDLGRYMRDRFARYAAALRGYAEAFGARDVPFIINIHGTEAGGGASFPIGISQLYESYTQAPGYVAGSDHYLGNLTAGNAPDWYLMNAFMEAVNLPDQPLTSVEFEAGEGDYGGSMGARLDPSAADFKLRMAVAQGNRLINYYLFTGGINYRMDRETGDGNDRISFTGERHGIGAPVNPEGVLSYTYPRLTRANTTLLALEDHVAIADEERDALAMAFIPDYFMTESVYSGSASGSEVMHSVAANLRRDRFGGPGTVLARALMQLTFRYTALDIQHRDLDPATTPVLALSSARYMAPEIQRKLVDYLNAGGNLFLHGEVPLFDMTGRDCRTLLDALGLNPVGERTSDHRYFLSLNADLWAAPRAEWRAGWAQTFGPKPDQTLLRVYGADEAAGFDIQVGQGRAIAITAEIPLDLQFFREALRELGAAPGLRHTSHHHNIFLSSTATPAGGRLIHALNLDGFDKTLQILDRGEPLFEGREITLRRRDGVMLPVNVDLGEVRIDWSTAEIAQRAGDSLVVRLTGPADAIRLTTSREIVPGEGFELDREGDSVLIRATIEGHGDGLKGGHLTIRWR
ncbi:MAG TPA: beta-galactosidase [Thermomicrobiales bacterium]|nr:beta-galactosidase [Thermomicrobiales bacterium]